MGTISRKFVIYGFCPVDKDDIPIEVEYTSLQLPNEDKHKKRFVKSRNCCWYLDKGKCDKFNDCPVFLEASDIRIEDFSNIVF